MTARLAAAVLLGCFLPAVADADVYRFDMGSAGSELRDGFTRVTADSLYGRSAGFGWKSSEGLKERVRAYSHEQRRDDRGRDSAPPVYTNEVTCDTIASDKPNAFLVDVPPGEYTVWLLGGLSAGSRGDYHDFDVAVGGRRSTVKIPGPYIFEKRTFTVHVASGPLVIELLPRTDWLVSGLVIFPTAEGNAVRADFLDALEKEIDFLPPDVAARWQQSEHVDPEPMPEFSAADRERGYAIFARHWSDVIYPNTVPRVEELDPKLEMFASLGEYEPATFTVHALDDLSGAAVSASEFRSGDAVIPTQNVDVRSVRYMLVRPNYNRFFSYHVAPDVLEHREGVDVPCGSNQRFWITVKVPDDAAPGEYEGRLTFRAAGCPAADVPCTLRVLPIRLKTNPEHIYGMYYYDPLDSVSPRNTPEANAYFLRKAEAERRDMAEHIMNAHTMSVSGLARDDEGHWSMDGESLDRKIAMDRKYGLGDKPFVAAFPVSYWYGRLVDRRGLGSHLALLRPDVPASFFAEVTKMVETIEKERKRRGWPEFLYYPIDEPSTDEVAVQFMVEVLRAVKRVPGVRTYVTANPSHEEFQPLWPHVDVWCCQPFVFGKEKIDELSRERGIEFWCYPNHICGENDHTPVRGARMTWGFGLWRSGFKTLIPWIYQYSMGSPWNYLDGEMMDFLNRSTPDGDPIPVTLWEAYREGIDDGRYIYTLQQLVAEGKRAGGTAAQTAEEAQKTLDSVWDTIKVQEKYKYDDLWPGAEFDAHRRQLADQIVKLRAVLNEGGVERAL